MLYLQHSAQGSSKAPQNHENGGNSANSGSQGAHPEYLSKYSIYIYILYIDRYWINISQEITKNQGNSLKSIKIH